MRIFLKICPLCLQTAPKCDKMILGYQNDHDLNTPNAATERVGRHLQQREKLHRLRGLPRGRRLKFAPERPA